MTLSRVWVALELLYMVSMSVAFSVLPGCCLQEAAPSWHYKESSAVLIRKVTTSRFPASYQLLASESPLPSESGSRGEIPEVSMALGVIEKLIEKRGKEQTRFSLVPKNPEMEKALETLRRYNPTTSPGDEQYQKKTGKLANGQWQVLYAPHIPRYILGIQDDRNTILSNVRYESKIFGNGWLNAAGSYAYEGTSTVVITFERFWWDRNADEASADPIQARMDLVQLLGKAGFVPSFSRFPVRYLDERLCEFEFDLSGTSILAIKVSPPSA